MKLSNFAAVIVLTGASLFLTACGGSGSTTADEAAINDINKKWQELYIKRNLLTPTTWVGEEANKYLDGLVGKYESALNALGAIKK